MLTQPDKNVCGQFENCLKKLNPIVRSYIKSTISLAWGQNEASGGVARKEVKGSDPPFMADLNLGSKANKKNDPSDDGSVVQDHIRTDSIYEDLMEYAQANDLDTCEVESQPLLEMATRLLLATLLKHAGLLTGIINKQM